MARDQRRLAAVVSADVAGYSRLMGEDESGTLLALKAHRRELFDPKIAEYGGRIVKTTGDGLLLEFPSVIEAVRCAVDVQRGMAERNAAVPDDARIEFRIGINVGDIIIDGDDIFGDGVNVAARLQTLAIPGGICVSRVVHDQVLDKLSFAFEHLGNREVKNIARPVDVYRVCLDPSDGQVALPQRITVRSARSGRRFGWASWAVAASVLAAVVIWALMSGQKPPASTPQLSVAIVPFTGDAELQRTADELTRDVASILGRDRWYKVIPPSRILGYKGNPSDTRGIGREFDVRYVAQGELRRAAEKHSLNLQVVDAASGSIAWSDRLEFRLPPGPAETTPDLRVARRLRNAIYTREIAYAGAHAQDNNPWNLYLRGIAALEDSTKREGDRAPAAHKLFQDALRIDPKFVPALVGDALALEAQIYEQLDGAAAPKISSYIDQIDKVTLRAVETDFQDSWAWSKRSDALAWQKRWNDSMAANQRARELSPDSVTFVLQRASLVLAMGRPADAIAIAKEAIALDPEQGQLGAASTICQAKLLLGAYEEAAPMCETTGGAGTSWWEQMLLVALYVQRNEPEKAALAKTTLLKLRPKLTISQLKTFDSYTSEPYRKGAEQYIYSPLRKAGIPDE
jgi:class 3 adenylate cyclase/TolB-like protein